MITRQEAMSLCPGDKIYVGNTPGGKVYERKVVLTTSNSITIQIPSPNGYRLQRFYNTDFPLDGWRLQP